MKQKSDSPLTKSVLKQELGALEKRMDKRFVTKTFFENSIEKLLQGIRREIGFAVETVVEKLEYRFTQINDQNLTKLDSISKELEEMREDKIIGGHQVEEKLDDYGKRIAKLEHSQQST